MNKLSKSPQYQFILFTCLTVFSSLATAAEKLPDRWSISLSAVKIDGSNTSAGFANTDSIIPIGIAVDLNRNLGIKDNDNSFRIDGYYRFTDRHQIVFSNYKIKLDGTKTLTEGFTWNDQPYEIGAQVSSFFNNTTTKLGYLFSFHHDNKVELAIGGGLHITEFNIGLNLLATADGGTAPSEFNSNGELKATAPVPFMSFLVHYDISQRWSFNWKYDSLRLSFNNVDGTMIDSMASVEHRTYEHVAFGFGVNSFRINIDGEDSTSRFVVKSAFDGILIYARAAF
ncbi:MAG: hypothetical protein ACC707_09200 [Thiohalomonadales bacterium]